MRSPWIALAVTAALVGCGGESEPEAASGSDREQVEAVIQDYLDALIQGDGERTCGHMTAAAQAQLKTWTAAPSCEEGVGLIGEYIDQQGPAEARDMVRNAGIEQVTVDGGKAEAQVDSGDGSPRPASLEKVGGAWKIAGFPAGATFVSQAHAECVAGGMNEFDKGGGDPFWQKEGREDFQDFIVETCRRADEQGALDPPVDNAVIQRIAGRVVVKMVRSGQIRDPQG